MLHVTCVSGKKVAKVIGVVNHVTNRGEVQFNALNMQIFLRQMWCQKCIIINKLDKY